MIDIDSYTRDAICQYLKENHPQFSNAQVGSIDVRVEDDFLICLIDCGIKGIPKIKIPADKLDFNPKPIPDVAKKPNGRRRKRGVKT